LPLLIGSVVLASAAAYLLTAAQPQVFEAQATVLVGPSAGADYNQLLASERLSTTYVSVATTRPVLQAVIGRLGLDQTAQQLEKSVFAGSVPDTSLVTITVHDGDASRAAEIANAIAAELVKLPLSGSDRAAILESINEDLDAIRTEIRATESEIEALAKVSERTPAQETQLETLQGRIVTLRSTFATLLAFTGSTTSLVTIVQPAAPATDAIAPRPLLNALLAAVVGLIVASAIAFLLEYLDDTIKTQEDVERVLGLPTLGTIMRMRAGKSRSEIYRLVPLLFPRSRDAEAYRTLRSNIQFAALDRQLRTLLVTSATPSEGKTVTAANLAIVFAQEGRHVLLVDADLRQPGVHDMFGLANHTGLTTLLRDEDVSLESVVYQPEQNLDILATGQLPPNPAELLGSQRMRAVLEQLQAAYDLVVFDSAPLELVADAAVLSSFLDATVLVVDAGRRRRETVRRARETLVRAGARVLGVCLNRIGRSSSGEYGLYYGADGETATGATVESSRQA
jgi:capsular exopolysaccharide synthesis family protein